MTDSVSELERQLNELKGALDLLFELREEFAQWVEEAQDGSKREALENVLGHIEALESEYRIVRNNCRRKRSPPRSKFFVEFFGHEGVCRCRLDTSHRWMSLHCSSISCSPIDAPPGPSMRMAL